MPLLILVDRLEELRTPPFVPAADDIGQPKISRKVAIPDR
jgi:hypothetical protein